jgi:hypothetical protein
MLLVTFLDLSIPQPTCIFQWFVFMFYVTLKQHKESEDEYKRLMENRMLFKFEKYWSEFSVVLAIAVILDPRFKVHFIDFSYKKLYGESSSREFLLVRAKLFSLFMEYNGMSPITSSTIAVEKHVDSQEYPLETTEMMKVNKYVYLLNYVTLLVYIILVNYVYILPFLCRSLIHLKGMMLVYKRLKWNFIWMNLGWIGMRNWTFLHFGKEMNFVILM